jgi:SAM-dependent methyltransferase
MVFNAYAAYYDLLYTDKDYLKEAEYVHELIKQHTNTANTILDLGCGTGKHAKHFAELGYSVVGVDKSAAMIDIAKEQFESDRIKFFEGDIRTFRGDASFDAVVSLFHVVSYLVNDADLQQTFEAVSLHLEKSGVFIFDCWYGPGVLNDPPFVSTKRMEDQAIEVERVATPKVFNENNVVHVDYSVNIRQKETGDVHAIQEHHAMRYLFIDEVKALALKNNMKVTATYKWLEFEDIGTQQCWNAVFVLQKQ